MDGVIRERRRRQVFPVIDPDFFDETAAEKFQAEDSTDPCQVITINEEMHGYTASSVYIDEVMDFDYREPPNENQEWERMLWEDERDIRQPKKIKARGIAPKMAKRAYKQRNHQSQRQRYQQRRKRW